MKLQANNEWSYLEDEVLVLGDALVEHSINGELVLSYNLPQIGGGNVEPADPNVKLDGKLLERGSISLQSESHPVEFRNIKLLNLYPGVVAAFLSLNTN